MAKLKKLSASRSPDAQSKVWELRTRLVKDELDAERVASNAKTSKLKALRLKKKRQEAEKQPQTAAEFTSLLLVPV